MKVLRGLGRSKGLYRSFSDFEISENLKKKFAKHDLDRYEKEKLILVDENDNEIGGSNIVQCHLTEFIDKQKTTHRAFSVLLFNSNFEMLLQRRAKTKPIFPLYWANACCSHPQKLIPGEDETIGAIGPKKAASRRLMQELNIQVPHESFKLQGILHYEASYDSTFSEREMDYIVAAQVSNQTKQVQFNPKEVDDTCWVARTHLLDWISQKKIQKEVIAPWFHHILEMGLLDWWKKYEDQRGINEPYGNSKPPIFNTIEAKRLKRATF